jgi:NAD+ synthase (glutamine-hydrolysing)
MIRVALAQMNLTVGDVDGNGERILAAVSRAKTEGAQVLVMPELAVSGYPPEDLLLRRSFLEACRRKVSEIARTTDDLLAIVGFPERVNDDLYNAAAICHGGEVVDIYHKQLLPNYGVFDEDRYFTEGEGHVLIDTQYGVLGVCVCEDAWSPAGPLVTQGDAGAQIILNINASPYHKGKLAERAEMLCDRARRARSSIVYVNMVGGQDELVFDGGSLVLTPEGEISARLVQFEETFAILDVPLGDARPTHSPQVRRVQLGLRPAAGVPTQPALAPVLGDEEEIYEALTLGLHDYARKNGFDKVIVGLSGGIDSTLTAAIAADALGPDAVLGVTMPSEFSSSGSVDDSKALAENLGIEMLQIPIASAYRAYIEMLEGAFGPQEMGLAEENLQARVRGNILMAVSNRYGHLVLATGNKSEMACGYATLYGDMAGGFALLKDLLKTDVYRLSRFRNRKSPVIPENVLTKPPSAELRPDQKDSDSLPPYDVLDAILREYIEEDAGIQEIVDAGLDGETVRRVVSLVDRAEYKRRQAPPGPKVTIKAFGRDRRLPITNRWREGTLTTAPDRSADSTED